MPYINTCLRVWTIDSKEDGAPVGFGVPIKEFVWAHVLGAVITLGEGEQLDPGQEVRWHPTYPRNDWVKVLWGQLEVITLAAFVSEKWSASSS